MTELWFSSIDSETSPGNSVVNSTFDYNKLDSIPWKQLFQFDFNKKNSEGSKGIKLLKKKTKWTWKSSGSNIQS